MDEGIGGEGWAGRALAHGVADGVISEAQGGNFRSGFYSGAFSSAASPLTDRIGGDGEDWHIASRTAVASVVGGTASVVGGGKFANGAITAAFDHLFNDEGAKAAEKRHESSTIVTESYYALPDSFAKKMLDFIGRMDPALELKDIATGAIQDKIVDTIDGVRMVQLREPQVIEIRQPSWWDRFNIGRRRVDEDEISPSTTEWNKNGKFYLQLLSTKHINVGDIESIVRVRTTITTGSDGWEINKPVPEAYKKFIK